MNAKIAIPCIYSTSSNYVMSFSNFIDVTYVKLLGFEKVFAFNYGESYFKIAGRSVINNWINKS